MSHRPPEPWPHGSQAALPDERRLVPSGWLNAAPVTQGLLALNVGVFLLELAASRSWGDIQPRQALELGACYSLAVVGEHRFETLITACFLHATLLHVGFNMLALWQAGPLVERAAGSSRMAPMYVLAGAVGNAASVAYGWVTRSSGFSVGASGAISGVLAAALVLGWRTQGWRGPLTQAMARWLGLVVVFGVASNLQGGHIDNAAHLGGALAGGVAASLWRRGRRPSRPAAWALVGASVAVVFGSVAVVAWHDRSDRFAGMMLQDRFDFTHEALYDGRCDDARAGLAAVERLRGSMAPVTSLAVQVEGSCGPSR